MSVMSVTDFHPSKLLDKPEKKQRMRECLSLRKTDERTEQPTQSVGLMHEDE